MTYLHLSRTALNVNHLKFKNQKPFKLFNFLTPTDFDLQYHTQIALIVSQNLQKLQKLENIQQRVVDEWYETQYKSYYVVQRLTCYAGTKKVL